MPTSGKNHHLSPMANIILRIGNILSPTPRCLKIPSKYVPGYDSVVEHSSTTCETLCSIPSTDLEGRKEGSLAGSRHVGVGYPDS